MKNPLYLCAVIGRPRNGLPVKPNNMKAKKDTSFAPVTLILESEEELLTIISLLGCHSPSEARKIAVKSLLLTNNNCETFRFNQTHCDKIEKNNITNRLYEGIVEL